jgi:hypothetical protein
MGISPGGLRSHWQTKDRVVLMTRSLMLKRLMMRMRSDFGLPIGTEHAHHQPSN